MEIDNKYIIKRREMIRNSYYFESLVMNAISKYLEKENKILIGDYLNNEDNKIVEFDGIIPDGIDGLEGQTALEIRLYKDKSTYFRNSREIAEHLNSSMELSSSVKSALVVLGLEFLDNEKEKLEKKFRQFIKYPIKIWDKKDLSKIDSRFNSYNIYDLSKIKEFVVNNAINKSLSESVEDWKKIRQDRLDELKAVYKRDELVLFLGAGVSKAAGINDWNDMISDLLVLMIKNKFSNNSIAINKSETDLFLKEMKKLNENSPLLQAAFIKAGLGNLFEKEVSNLLYKNINNDTKGTSKLLKSIAKLCLPRRNGIGVQAVVTYNFDDLLEVNLDKFNIEYHSLYNEMDYTAPDKLGVYHVHGFLPRYTDEYEQLSESLLVFSEDGYHSLYNDPYSWANITQLNFLRENTTLMIGLSLTDPNLRRLLAISNRKTKTTKHYAFMKRYDFSIPSDNGDIRVNIIQAFNTVNNELQEKFFEQLGIKVIWVEKYDEIPTLVESIKSI